MFLIGILTLNIVGVKADETANDGGEYQVEFSNRAGDKKVSSTLTVHCKLL